MQRDFFGKAVTVFWAPSIPLGRGGGASTFGLRYKENFGKCFPWGRRREAVLTQGSVWTPTWKPKGPEEATGSHTPELYRAQDVCLCLKDKIGAAWKGKKIKNTFTSFFFFFFKLLLTLRDDS